MNPSKSQKIIIQEINKLKREKNAIILCHNYQRPEIYEVADFIGDSLELCKKARESSARMIIFCGVHFMAESAAILNPKMKVVVPEESAGCALADMVDIAELRKLKAKYPLAAVVCYVNTTAKIKAESDICCTSSNAVEIVRSLSNKQIIFVPDKNLADYVAKRVPEKEIIAWDGYCPIHHRLTARYLLEAKKAHPKAKIIAHPECIEDVLALADFVASTSGMVDIAKKNKAKEFICITECGMVQRMQREIPKKKFFTVCNICFSMKKNTLQNIKKALILEKPIIKVSMTIQKKALRAFDGMFAVMDKKETLRSERACE